MSRKKHKGLFVSILLATIFMVAFGGTFFLFSEQSQKQSAQNLTVVTSFYPMYIAAMNICDSVEGVTLENLSEPQTGCLHDYQLTPEDMKLLSTADVFVVNGGGIEEFLTDVAKAYPELVIVDASQDIEISEDNAHVWMSVESHIRQVQNIAAGLAAVDAQNAHGYTHNAEHYCSHLQELAEEEATLKQELSGQSVVLFQEAYAYLAEDLGLTVAYVLDLDEERQVSAGEVSAVMKAIRQQEVSVVFADDVYAKEMSAMVEDETDAVSVCIDTLVRGTYDKNSYLTQMQQNIDAIREAYGVN